jgi:cation diffusion facilitator CzcD-associated flavoprotein CzcO
MPTTPRPSDLGFDLDALRAKYRHERERRLRPAGLGQYRPADGEFGYLADDPYTEKTDRAPLNDRVEVLVIGGGFGGLVAAARLRMAGVEDVRIIEKAGDFGGTWYWNRYPGICCDIESYVYLPLLDEVGYVPEWKYAPGEEIRRHALAIAEKFDLYRDVCFQTVVTELRWDDDGGAWTVRTDRGDEVTARHVVFSGGTLDRPKLPGIPGIETFTGHTFHTSRWDYDYTGGTADGGLTGLADKRVALVGTGASAIQVVPHLGRDAAHLYVFQRTPSTVDYRGNRPTDREWAASLEPGWARRRRENFLTVVHGGAADEDMVADAWTSSTRLFQKLVPTNNFTDLAPDERDRYEELADFQKMTELRARVDEIVADPATAELLKPWYRYMCKRPTFSDHYLQTFNRPNVTLVDTADHGGIERVTENAVVVGEREYPVDCVIFATGFQVGFSDVLVGRLPVYGRKGVSLLEAWSTGLRSLHGFYTNGFPNLYHLGPMQKAPSVNFTHVLDEQAVHVAALIAEARGRGAAVVEPSAAAEQAWVDALQEKAEELYRFQAECTPGYYNNEGMPLPVSFLYGDGPVAFHDLLRGWRENGGMDEVMVAE